MSRVNCMVKSQDKLVCDGMSKTLSSSTLNWVKETIFYRLEAGFIWLTYCILFIQNNQRSSFSNRYIIITVCRPHSHKCICIRPCCIPLEIQITLSIGQCSVHSGGYFDIDKSYSELYQSASCDVGLCKIKDTWPAVMHYVQSSSFPWFWGYFSLNIHLWRLWPLLNHYHCVNHIHKHHAAM